MKKLLSIAALCGLAVLSLLLVQCEGLLGGAPTLVKIVAATDTSVKVTWSAPIEGTPDKYIVYFKGVGEAGYTQLGEVTSPLEYVDNPGGATGSYKVTAQFGSDTYDGTAVSSEPVHTAVTTLFELNAAGSSGYGWYRVDGEGSTYSMEGTTNVASVDLYFTDWASGSSVATQYIVSPDLGTGDPGGVIQAGAWKANGYNGPVAEQTPLPAHTSGVYVGSKELTQYPFFMAVWMQDDYFALAKFSDLNQSASSVKVETWFQLVKGLRLIQH